MKKEYNHFKLIHKPIITEKSTILSESGKYLFKVGKEANKQSIKSAIEHIFNVEVEKINVLVNKGKMKRFKGNIGFRSDNKKAIVTLKKGFTIDYTGGVK